MASVFNKRNILYISWYDPNLGKNKNRSTGLPYNSKNLKKAKEIASTIEKKIEEQRERDTKFGIKKVTLEKAKKHFLENNSDKNPNTISGYQRFFVRFCSAFPLDQSCSNINKLAVESWLNGIKKLELQRNTIYGIMKNLKKFLSFLFEYNYVPPFVINKDIMVSQEVKEIILFSDADLVKIMENLSEKNSNFRTMIYTLIYTGLRPTDIINLKVSDVDFTSNVLHYFSIKTQKHFVIPIHPELIPILQARCTEVETGEIFNYGGAKEMGKAFQRYLKDLELNKKSYNLRTFRKSFISRAYDSGIDLAVVSNLVGHSSISTTAKFYNKIKVSKLGDQLQRFQLPINKNVQSAEVEMEVETVQKDAKNGTQNGEKA